MRYIYRERGWHLDISPHHTKSVCEAEREMAEYELEEERYEQEDQRYEQEEDEEEHHRHHHNTHHAADSSPLPPSDDLTDSKSHVLFILSLSSFPFRFFFPFLVFISTPFLFSAQLGFSSHVFSRSYLISFTCGSDEGFSLSLF